MSTTGATTTTDIGVGAHQRHLTDGAFRRAMNCTECHVVPRDAGDPGHLDTTPFAEVSFATAPGSLSNARGASPTWSHVTATCANTYCHGATLDGGTLTRPVWTVVNGTQAACGTCHGHPPPLPHAQFTQCHNCHPGTVTATEALDLAGGHINGTLESQPVHLLPAWNTRGSGNFHGDAANLGLAACGVCHGATLTGGPSNVSCDSAACHPTWKTNCVFCHGGTDNATGAPLKDLADLTATSAMTVGSHTSHLSARHGISGAMACASCHVVPGGALSPGHVDPSPAEVTFGGLATTGGVAPVWNRTAGTCAGSYCHGNFQFGATTNLPVFTNVTGSAVTCSSCHLARPTSRSHSNQNHVNRTCDECHNTIVTANTVTPTGIVTPSLHVNGTKDVRLKQGGTWNASTRACTPACHQTETW